MGGGQLWGTQQGTGCGYARGGQLDERARRRFFGLICVWGMAMTAGLLVLLAAQGAHAENLNMELVGKLDIPTDTVAVNGDYAYIGKDQVMRVIDIRDPSQPVEIGQCSLPARVTKIDYNGNLACASVLTAGIQVIDVSNPTTPVLMGKYVAPDSVYYIDMVDNLVYAAVMNKGLYIVDVSNPTTPTLRGVCLMPAGCAGVRVFDGLAYLNSGQYGVRIVDVTNPDAPFLIGNNGPTGSGYFDVAIWNGFACFAHRDYGLKVFDISSPLTPILRGSHRIDVRNGTSGIVAANGLAYVAGYGVYVVDVSNPRAPLLVGSYAGGLGYDLDLLDGLIYSAERGAGLYILRYTGPAAQPSPTPSPTPTPTATPTGVADVQLVGTVGGFSKAVAMQGNYAYMAEGCGLRIVDVENPEQPILLGKYQLPQEIQGLSVSGNLAFVAAGAQGMQIIDISNPAAPALRGSYATSKPLISLATYGNLAFLGREDNVSNNNNYVEIVEITNPQWPVLCGGINVWVYPRSIAYSNGIAYLTGTGGTIQVNVSNPFKPTYNEKVISGLGYGYDLDISGNHLFVAVASLAIADISDPSAVTKVGSLSMPGIAQGVAVSGNLAFVADRLAGLQVADVSNPAAPVLKGGRATRQSALGVAASGKTACVVSGNGGLDVVDATNPAAPALKWAYNPPGYSENVAVAGSIAYIADGYKGLRVVDLANVAGPVQIGACDTPGYARDVAVSGAVACVADKSGGLRMIDVSDPAAPVASGVYSLTTGTAMGVAFAPPGGHVSGVGGSKSDGSGAALVYLAAEQGGLHVVDVSDPAAPSQVGVWAGEAYALDVAVADGRAYLAAGTDGLLIVDVTDPTSPILLGAIDTPFYAVGVAVSGDLAFVADEESGLQIFNVSNPAQPYRRGWYNTAGYPENVVVAGNLAYVADYWGGLRILDVSNPGMPALKRTYSTPYLSYGVAVTDDGAVCLADGGGGLYVLRYSPVEPSPTPTPYPSATASPTPGGSNLPGDLSSNGMLDAEDVSLAYGALCGTALLTPQQQASADANGDGVFDIADLLWIRAHLSE